MEDWALVLIGPISTVADSVTPFVTWIADAVDEASPGASPTLWGESADLITRLTFESEDFLFLKVCLDNDPAERELRIQMH